MSQVASDPVTDRLHPAAFGVVLYLLVSVGRLPELLTVLSPLHLGKISLMLALLGMLMASGGPRMQLFAAGPGRLLLVFIALMVLSVIWSFWRSNSIMFLAGVLLSHMLLFYLLVRTAVNPRMLRLYVNALLGAGVLLAMMMVKAGGADRVFIVSSYDPNDLALVLVTVLPLAVLGFFISRGLRRYVMAAVTAAILVATLFTASRGGFVALLAVSAYLFLTRLPMADGRLTERLSARKVLVVVLGAGLLAVVTPQVTWERIATILTPEQDYNLTDDTGRVAIWTRGIGAMIERPWGWGVLSFEAVEGERGGRFQASHNSLIQVGVELGIAGVVVVLLIYLTCLRRLQAVRMWAFANGPPGPIKCQLGALAIALRASFIAYFVGAFFLSAAYTALFFTLVALVLALENVRRLNGDDGIEAENMECSPAPGFVFNAGVPGYREEGR